MTRITATRFKVTGVHNDDDTKKAMQPLFDIFSDEGMGQATFEITGGETADLIIKHLDTVTPDIAILNEALAKAGDYKIVG